MSKLNIINKIYAAVFIAVVLATIIKMYSYYSTPRYFYTASFTAPPTYPVYIQDGYFILEDDEMKGINYDHANQGQFKWGEGDIDVASSAERLPKALVVKYASYRDKSFYSDTIPLPQKLINDAFEKQRKEHDKQQPANTFSTPPELSLLIGLANNGNIVVWLQGYQFEQKLLTAHIKPRKPIEEQYYHTGKYLPAEYFKHFELTDAYKQAEAKGIDKDANYADSSTHYLHHEN